MNQKLVSIVIPAYNEQEGIVECIQSIKNQSYRGPKEIIIVDNNSIDNTNALAKSEGVTVIVEKIPGVCAARQAGTLLAKGEIIVSSDADTTFPVNWLENIMNAFEKNPDIVAVGGPFILKNAPWWGELIFSDLVFGIVKAAYYFSGRSMLFGSNTAFKKEAWEGYDINVNQGGDEVLLLRQLRKKGRILFLPNNSVLTSSRRMDKGFLHFLIFYVFDYFFSLIFGRNLVPPRAIRIPKEQLKS
jgi:glycosyltransferase involved in cell wall biosynthesis